MYKQFLKDLRWIYRQYGTLFITTDQISDYTRTDDVEEIEAQAASGAFGTGHRTGATKTLEGYNAISVVCHYLRLDSKQRHIIISYIVASAKNESMSDKKEKAKSKKKSKGNGPSITERPGGLLMAYAHTRAGRKACYSKNREELLLKVEQVELEDRQRAFMERVSQLPSDKIESMNVSMMTYAQSAVAQNQATGGTGEEGASTTSIAPTFEQAFRMWMVYARKEKLLRPTSSDSYENTYRFYFSSEKWFTQKPVDEITTNDGFTFLNSIINKTVTKDKFSTINQVLYGTIWHIINDCEEYANLNIKLRKDLVKLKLKKVYKKIRKRARPDEEAITDEQLKIFLEEIDHQIKKGSGNKKARYYMVKLNFYLGLRIGELAALEVGDIDLDNKMIYIRKGEVRYKEVDENFEYTGHYVREVSEPKTNNAVRSLPIIDEAYQIILELYAYRKAHKYTNKKLMYDDNTSDHYIAHLHAAYTTLKKRTGLGLWCHLQRKTYATRLFNGHADSADIQKLMGHSSIRTTMDNYIISEGDRDARVQTTVQSIFKSASSENEDNLGTTV